MLLAKLLGVIKREDRRGICPVFTWVHLGCAWQKTQVLVAYVREKSLSVFRIKHLEVRSSGIWWLFCFLPWMVWISWFKIVANISGGKMGKGERRRKEEGGGGRALRWNGEHRWKFWPGLQGNRFPGDCSAKQGMRRVSVAATSWEGAKADSALGLTGGNYWLLGGHCQK